MELQALHSGLNSINEVFSPGTRYVVPRYQREYSWTKDQVQEFIDDVKGLMRPDRSRKEPYFFGAMVFVHQPSDDDDAEDTFKIVDGQQRLTTSAVMIAVIRDILNNMGKTEEAAEFNRNIQEKDMETGEFFDRITLSERNLEFFREHIMKIGDPKEKSKIKEVTTANKDLLEAYSIIYDAFKEPPKDQDQTKYLVTLCDRFTKIFKIIVVTVPSNAHAYKIFETLNNRGLELSEGDLVKNYLLEQCESDEDLQKEIFETWQQVIETLDKISIDDFLRHFWLANHEKIKKDDIYKKLTDIVPKRVSVKDFVDKLEKYAEIYAQIMDPQKEDWWENENIVEILKTLRILNSKVCYPTILVAKDNLHEKDFEQLSKMCLNFFFRYKTICGKHATPLENLMIEVAEKIREAKSLDEIKKLFLDPGLYPEDKEFRRDFETIRMTDKTAIYVLKKLNGPIEDDKTVIEYIMPRNIIGTEWEKYLKKKGLAADDLESYVDQWSRRLGNLTLMKKLTNDERKKPYSEKWEQFYRKSPVRITNELPSDPEWFRDQIAKRQKDFAQKALDIWKIQN